MVRRILRTLALSVAVLTAGFAGIAATPGTASAEPVGGLKKAIDVLPGYSSHRYDVKLHGDEPTRIQVAALEDDLELRVYGPNGVQVGQTIYVRAGTQEDASISPYLTGTFTFKITNPYSSSVKYCIILD